MGQHSAAAPTASTADSAVGIVVKRFWSFGSADAPFTLENGRTLPRVEVAYETYGTLNAARDNVILVQHGLSGSSHAAGKYALQNRSVGYWDGLIGPGKVFDTDRSGDAGARRGRHPRIRRQADRTGLRSRSSRSGIWCACRSVCSGSISASRGWRW